MKQIFINGFCFEYEVRYNSDYGSFTKFYFGVELSKNVFTWKKPVPKYVFSLPINIENPERTKDELREVLEARVKKYFQEEIRKQEIANGNLI